jgi:hypothetical protein
MSTINNINPRDYNVVNDKLTNNEGTLKDSVKNSVDIKDVDIKDSVDVNEKIGSKEVIKIGNEVVIEIEKNRERNKFTTGERNKFTTGGWKGGLFRIADLANKIVPFTVKFAGAISFLAGLGAFFNFLDGIGDVSCENVHNKIDGVIDLASVVAWGAAMLGSISAPVSLAIAGGLYGAKIINYAIAKHNENKQNKYFKILPAPSK